MHVEEHTKMIQLFAISTGPVYATLPPINPMPSGGPRPGQGDWNVYITISLPVAIAM